MYIFKALGADSNAQSITGWTSLALAAKGGYLEVKQQGEEQSRGKKIICTSGLEVKKQGEKKQG